jgi:hypothetical protein
VSDDGGLSRQVDEEVRRDRMTSMARRYGPVVGLAALAIVAVAASIVGWRAWQTNQRVEAGNTYAQALGLVGVGRLEEAAQALETLAQSAPSGYATLSLLQAAAIRAEQGDSATAADLYARLAGDSSASQDLRQFAALMVVQHSFDSTPDEELLVRLEPLVGEDSAWRFSAREFLAHVAIRRNDVTEARNMLSSLASDPATPGGVRDRARDMLAALAGG